MPTCQANYSKTVTLAPFVFIALTSAANWQLCRTDYAELSAMTASVMSYRSGVARRDFRQSP